MLKKMITVIFLILIITVNNFSQWSQNPYENNPICTVSGGQQSPRITSDSKGGAIIAWEDFRNDTSRIYVQRIDKNGNIKWNINGVPLCNFKSGQSSPHIINDSNGGAIIVWVDDRYGNFDLFVQRIDSLGNKLWNSDGLLVFENSGNQTQPQIVKTSDNIFYVVCLDDRMGTQNLFIQKIDLQGNMIWSENGKMGNHFRSLRNFKAIVDNDNNLVLVWEDFSFNNDGMIFTQKINSNGNFLWEFNQDDLLISSNNLNIKAQHPDLIRLQNGNYMIAWQDNRAADFDIYGQILLPNGANVLTDEGEYLEGSIGDDVAPILCTSGNQYYLIAWINNNYPQSFVKARSFYTNPVTFIQYWSQTLIVAQQNNGGWFNYLNLTPDKAGGALLSFVNSDAEYSDISSAKISAYGDKRGVKICRADLNQGQLAVCSDSSDGLIAVWADIRSGDFDIYCSQVDANGVLGTGQHQIGLIADYKFNGDASDAAYQNNATVFNAPLTTDRFGNPNSAYEFNGINAFISAPSSPLLESPRYELTQTAWVNLYNWGISGNSFIPIIMKSSSPENSFQYRLGLSPNTVVTSVNNWLNTVYQTGFNMNLNEWYMITSVFKEDTVFTYVNNEYVGFAILIGPIISDNKPLVIGKDVPGSTEYFYGKLDDIKIFNRALTQKEILNLYNAGNTTEINERKEHSIPTEFSLAQNYPNPFNPSTKISWQLPVAGHQTLKVYDILGNEVATLVNEYQEAGRYEVIFDASKLSSGVYFYKLQSGSFQEIKKMILLR